MNTAPNGSFKWYFWLVSVVAPIIMGLIVGAGKLINEHEHRLTAIETSLQRIDRIEQKLDAVLYHLKINRREEQ